MPPPPTADTRALVGALLAEEGPARAEIGPWLLAVEGPRAGRRLWVRDGAVLGRGRGADLRLDGGLTSRRHARFIRAVAGWQVVDLGSKNGLRVNGRPAQQGGLPLAPGDLIALGESVLLFGEERTLAPDAVPGPEREVAARPAFRPVLAAAAALLALAAALAAAAS